MIKNDWGVIDYKWTTFTWLAYNVSEKEAKELFFNKKEGHKLVKNIVSDYDKGFENSTLVCIRQGEHIVSLGEFDESKNNNPASN